MELTSIYLILSFIIWAFGGDKSVVEIFKRYITDWDGHQIFWIGFIVVFVVDVIVYQVNLLL